MANGLFVGLVTLDLVYLTSSPPENNQKIAASDYTVAAGGPATNAAVAFAHLGGCPALLGVVGNHPLNPLIRADLTSHGVEVVDLDFNRSDPPPVSSIIVTQTTGERAIVSLNAQKLQASRDRIPAKILQNVEVVLIDGHQIEVGQAIAQAAQAHQIPVVLDGGSWKPGLEKLLPFVNYAICSADFYPPGCRSSEQVLAYLSAAGIAHLAITHGKNPLQYTSCGTTGWIEVPTIRPIDTFGAGDIFHGAFCHYILQLDFASALREAAKIAAYACQFFGTRQWLEKRP